MNSTKNEVYRGDIFYVENSVKVKGSEQSANRPAVIVSNNIGNKHSEICEVVYITSKEKKPLPTHVPVLCKVPSTALCEQVTSVCKYRLTEFVRSCTEEEMKAIDKGIKISLALDTENNDAIEKQKEIDDLKKKLECAEKMLEEQIEKYKCMEKSVSEIKLCPDQIIDEEKIRTKTERDMYKSLYEQTIERMIAR